MRYYDVMRHYGILKSSLKFECNWREKISTIDGALIGNLILFGNDECWDLDIFYQWGYDPENERLYKIFYCIDDDRPLDSIEYRSASYFEDWSEKIDWEEI